MTALSTVSVSFGDRFGLNNLDLRTTGMQVTTRVALGDFGSNRAVITVRNDDGALTPGGGGTYSSVDWYSQALFIEGQVGAPNAFILFHGMITSFRLVDDGVNSVVELEADDFYTIGGRQVSSVVWGPPYGKTSVAAFIEDLYNGVTISGFPRDTVISGVSLPRLGSSQSEAELTDVGAGVGSYLAEDPLDFSSPVRDIIRANLMPSSPSVAWPTILEFRVSPTRSVYHALACTTYPVRSAFNNTFVFSETPSAGQLPFKELVRGFNTDTLLNNAQIEAATPIGVTASSTNTASVEKYGAHTIRLSEIIPPSNPTTRMPILADRWANTFADSAFTVQRFTVTEQMVKAKVGSSATSLAQWALLLDVQYGPVQPATITYTPAGAASPVTESFIIMSRKIQRVPGDFRIVIECLPADQSGAFVLDSSTLGVLDQNRLG